MSDRLTNELVANLAVWAADAKATTAEVEALAREVQTSRKLIADLRALHVAEVDEDDDSPTQGETFCANCEHEDPCPTIRMIDEAGL